MIIEILKAKARIEENNKAMSEAIGKGDLTKAQECRSLIEADMVEIKKIESEAKTQEELSKLNKELEELRKLKNTENTENKGVSQMEKRSYKNSIKVIKEGKTVSNRAIVVHGATTEAVVPEQFIKELEVLKEGYGSLKNEVTEVIPVNTLDGRKSIAQLGGKLAKITAGNRLPVGDIEFEQMAFHVDAYGEIVEVDNQLAEDSAVDIFNIIKDQFAEKAVNAENEEILAQIDAVKGTDLTIGATNVVDALVEAIDEYKPAVRKRVMILASQELINKVKSARIGAKGVIDERVSVDMNGNVLIEGHKMVEIDPALIPVTATDVVAYMVVKGATKFFDRKGIEIKVSEEVLFDQNADAIRVVERFDVVAMEQDIVKPRAIKF